MSPLSRQVTGVSTPLSLFLPKTPYRRRRRRRRFLTPAAVSFSILSCFCLPLWSIGSRMKVVVLQEANDFMRINPRKRFSKKDMQRICKTGPTIDDLKQYHTVTKKLGMGRKVDERIAFIRGETLDGGMEIAEPRWNSMKEIPFMQFYKGIETRNWRSDFFDPDASPWSIRFYEDSGRLFRPCFRGYRAVIQEEGKDDVWCRLDRPGSDPYAEDYLFPRYKDSEGTVPRTNELGYPSSYGYQQLFNRLGVAWQQEIPEDLEDFYEDEGYIPSEDKHRLTEPSKGLLDVSFHLTHSEPSLHSLWYTVPQIGLIIFALTFLGLCLMIGIFKPKKQMPADPMQAMEFAQSKGRARKDGRTDVRFEDIAGLDKILTELKEIVEFLKEPGKYHRLGAKPPKGVLLEGPPGTGKTLIAKAIAGEAGVPFYQMSGSEFVEAIVGVGAARIRDLFKRARAQAEACIIFVDEIDALGSKRGEAGILTNEEREQTLNQLLTEMDGFTSEMGVVFVGATNRADLLDPALQRPGRFDRKILVVRPDTEGRYDILKIHSKRYKISKDVDFLQLSRDLPGLAGAELANIMNEAALEAIRRAADEIETVDVYNAVDRVIQGIRHPTQPAELMTGRVFAVHEMGRAIVSVILRDRTNRLEAVEKLSIVARGRNRTRTVFFRGKDEDYTMTTRSRMLERISVILAGRAAEEHVFGEPTTYSCKDLGPAFRLAEKIVSNYGLSDLGITSYAPVVQNPDDVKSSFEVNVDNIDEDLFGRGLTGGMFQGSDSSVHRMLTKCHQIMREAYQESVDIIQSYASALEVGSKLLLEKQELTGEEVEKIVRQCPPKLVKKPMTMDDSDDVYEPQGPSPLSTGIEEEETMMGQARVEETVPT